MGSSCWALSNRSVWRIKENSAKGNGGGTLKACGMRTEPQRPPRIELRPGVSKLQGEVPDMETLTSGGNYLKRQKGCNSLLDVERRGSPPGVRNGQSLAPCALTQRGAQHAGKRGRMWMAALARQALLAVASNPELSMTVQS